TIAYTSLAGTTFVAASMTWANSGFPPTSCKTLGCLDLSRVPLPAAMIAIAIRGAVVLLEAEECFLEGDIGFQYTATLGARTSLSAQRTPGRGGVAAPTHLGG